MNKFETAVREVWPDKADDILAVVRGRKDPTEFPKTAEWVNSCFNEPTQVEQQMRALDEIIEGFGTEAIFGSRVTWPDMEYVNLGDTYNTTLIYDYTREKFFVMSWGDWIEWQERCGVTYN